MSAVSAEMADGTTPLKRFLVRALCHDAPSHSGQIESALALHGLAGTHRETSLVSAAMLAGKGPLKAFVCSRLRACGRARARSDRCADIHLVVCVRARMRTHKQNCTCARTPLRTQACSQYRTHQGR